MPPHTTGTLKTQRLFAWMLGVTSNFLLVCPQSDVFDQGVGARTMVCYYDSHEKTRTKFVGPLWSPG